MSRRVAVIGWELMLLEPGGSHQGETVRIVDTRGQSTDLQAGTDSRRELAVELTDSGEARPWVSPKTLVGAFAAHLRRQPDPALATELLGDPLTEGASAPRPSLLRFLGSSVQVAGSPSWQHRAAQDRWSGSARAGQLSEHEWLPVGSTITIWAIADSHRRRDIETVVDTVATATLGRDGLGVWAPFVGSGVSTGHGRTRLTDFRTVVLDLSVPGDLAFFLGGLSPSRLRQLLDSRGQPEPIPEPADQALFHVSEWDLDGPLHIGHRKEEWDVGGAPRELGVLLTDDAGRPVIPGTSWKGLLRSRAEFILRSLGVHACRGGTDDCLGCPTCDIFGGTGQRTGSIGSGWSAAVRVETGALQDETGAPAAKRAEPFTHVAIDRFTGGAAEGLLYNNEVVITGGTTLKITIGPRTPPEYAEPLIILALRDLADGLIGLGHQSSRGYGTMISSAELTVDPDGWGQHLAQLRRKYPSAPVEEQVG